MKKTMIIMLLAGLVLASSFTRPARVYKNLAVLDKRTTPAQMGNIMSGFSKALGTGCGFCHGAKKESDEKPEKNIARAMMRVCNKINKKYFASGTVTCNTCHQGKPQP